MQQGTLTIDCKIVRPPETVSEYEIVENRRVLRVRKDVPVSEQQVRLVASPFPNRVFGAGDAAPKGWQGAYAELLDDLLYRLDGPLVAVRWTPVPVGVKKYTAFLEGSAVRQLSDQVKKEAGDLRDRVSRQSGGQYLTRLLLADEKFGLEEVLSDPKMKEHAGAGYMRAGLHVLSELVEENEAELAVLYAAMLRSRAHLSYGTAKRQWSEILKVLQR